MASTSKSSSVRGRPLKSQAREIVYKVNSYLKCLKKEYELDMNVTLSTAEATGVGVTTVKKIVSEGKMSAEKGQLSFVTPKGKKSGRRKRIDLDDVAKCCTRRKIHKFYADGEAEVQASKDCSVDVGGVSSKTEVSEDFPLTEVFVKVEPKLDPSTQESLPEHRARKNVSTTLENKTSGLEGTSFDLTINGNTIKEETLEIDDEMEDDSDSVAEFEEEDPLAEECVIPAVSSQMGTSANGAIPLSKRDCIKVLGEEKVQ